MFIFISLTQGFPSTNALSACDISSDGKIVASGGFGTEVNNQYINIDKYFSIQFVCNLIEIYNHN